MRIAVLADIHGNLAALEAALEHLARQQIDTAVVAGDVVNCAPDSLACWEQLRALGYPTLRGNHERYVFDFDTPQAPPEWSGERYRPVQWTVKQFSPHLREELRALPFSLRLDAAPELVFLHATLRSDAESVRFHTSLEELRAMFVGVRADVIVRGHNHLCFHTDFDGVRVVTAGSVGLPLTQVATAQYAILQRDEKDNKRAWTVAYQSVPYDVEATLRRFRESGLREEGGPIARLLMREVATATAQLTPFLSQYARWSRAGEVSLEQAVANFLNAY